MTTPRLSGLHPAVFLLATAHFIVDGYGNIFAPLLPLLIPQLGLSLAAVGTLQMCFQMANSVAQLGFGHIADRWRPRVLLLVGPAVGVSLLPLIGLAPNVWAVAAVLIIGGLGGAAFHPPAAALVHRVSSGRQGLAMASYIAGGSMGTALAPLVFATLVQRFGLAATPVLIVPALIACTLLLKRVPRLDHVQERGAVRGFAALRPYAAPLALLYSIVVLRTVTALGFATFTPVMLTQRGMSMAEAGTAVAIYLFASSIGGFVGGPLADRLGARRVIIFSLAGSVPFLAAAPAFSGWTFVALLAIGGWLLQSTLPVNVTFGQTLAPISAATVSSLMMGFAWGTGGLSAPFVGMLADRIGIERTLMALSCVPLLAAALAWPLPSRKPARVNDMRKAAHVDGPGTEVAD